MKTAPIPAAQEVAKRLQDTRQGKNEWFNTSYFEEVVRKAGLSVAGFRAAFAEAYKETPNKTFKGGRFRYGFNPLARVFKGAGIYPQQETQTLHRRDENNNRGGKQE